ncbi:hypothetical protein [Mucilaginibacter lappiensis]|uniref:Uncharacterized protein n=1 Tax=Mucilaginibacter lappiensis TaxID=354630 RepID=A0A841JLF9_9SPHI|nr:hypothetical protein [Mucilaginibacter lappiensis]MBB6131112.1 hypothetical protein [Mucilaginibacter lappiensis]
MFNILLEYRDRYGLIMDGYKYRGRFYSSTPETTAENNAVPGKVITLDKQTE